jgi:SAM-dependent methyltransferase
MRYLAPVLALTVVAFGSCPLVSQTKSSPRYETRTNHDPNGTGTFYMGREIAQVMGPGGIEWLDRGQRDTEEHPTQVLDALQLHSGKVLAVDVQDEMLQTLKQRAARNKIANVQVIKGSETDPHLPAGAVDLVLMVDVYHELAYPHEVIQRVRDSLKPDGRVAFVEYRKEDQEVPIKDIHKMSVAQLEKEMTAVGLVLVRRIETLPLQHILIFGTGSEALKPSPQTSH